MTRQGNGKRTPASRWKRWVVGLLVLAAVSSLAAYLVLLNRARARQARLDAFLRLDERYECCTLDRSPLPGRCRAVLEDLVDLGRHGDVSRPAPDWLPAPVRMYLDLSRGADPVSQQAVVLYWQCPNAQELAHRAVASPAEQMCGVAATWEQREDLARESARRGTLVRALVNLPCSRPGYEAGLRRIQTDFNWLCARDACIDVLLNAPQALRERVREIVSAHADAVLTALAPLLGPAGDSRAAGLLSDVFGRDSGAIAALSREDLDGLELASAVDLLELPLNPRKAFLLRHIRDRSAGAVSSVAAVFLDAAEAATATVPELRQGLLALADHQCVLVERAIQRLELETASRADAALPALVVCPEAAQAALADRDRFSLTRRVLEAALTRRLVNVETILVDRLTRADLATVQMFLKLAARPSLNGAAMPIVDALKRSSAARYRLIHAAFPDEPVVERRRVVGEDNRAAVPVEPASRIPGGERSPVFEPGAGDRGEPVEVSPAAVEPTFEPPASPTEEQLLIRDLRRLGFPTPAAKGEE